MSVGNHKTTVCLINANIITINFNFPNGINYFFTVFISRQFYKGIVPLIVFRQDSLVNFHTISKQLNSNTTRSNTILIITVVPFFCNVNHNRNYSSIVISSFVFCLIRRCHYNISPITRFNSSKCNIKAS